MQAIEAGKIELNTLNGNSGSYFFTFYRTNGGATGDWVGGYNESIEIFFFKKLANIFEAFRSFSGPIRRSSYSTRRSTASSRRANTTSWS